MTFDFHPRSLQRRLARGVVGILLPGQILMILPAQAVAAGAEPRVPEMARSEPKESPAVHVNRAAPIVRPVPPYPVFSNSPTTEEIFRARVFGEPIIPLGAAPTEKDNKVIATVLDAFLHSPEEKAQLRLLEGFNEREPGSPYRASLLMNAGALYRRKGYFTRAEKALREAWDLSKAAEGTFEKTIADGAVGELLDLYKRFGRLVPLEQLVEEVGSRPLTGSPAERFREARSSVWVLHNQHEQAVPSGPAALGRIRHFLNPSAGPHPAIAAFHADDDGATLVEMRDLAQTAGLSLRMAKRLRTNARMVLPAMMHWKVGHFSAILREQGGYFLVDDPCLGGEFWVSREALDEEASGYFLLPEVRAADGWADAPESEASLIRGKCANADPHGGDTRLCSRKSGGCNGGICRGPMTTYSFHMLLGSLHLEDTPVGYSPPRGPAVSALVTYNQRESYKPLNYTFSNLGQRWNLYWIAWVEDDPTNPSATAYVHEPGGGRETLSGFNGTSYASELQTQSVVTRVTSSPIRYEKLLSDGSKEVYAQSDGAATSPRRVFLTQLVDPQGNALSMTYDAQLRLVGVTDAIGQVTTLSYDLTGSPLKITKITDPFGRSALFDYGSSGQLVRITDVIGIRSEFEYGFSDFVKALTTPYGTTLFAATSGINGHVDYGISATDPVGGTERLDWILANPTVPASEPASSVPTGFASMNNGLASYSAYYWDKRAWALYPGDYTKAEITRWNFSSVSGIADSFGSQKKPLENRVWYLYAGTPLTHGVGPMNKPLTVARVLDDGSSQTYRYEYNALGKVTRFTDPVGRATTYTYAANGIDLQEIRQVNGQTTDLIQSKTYNSQHKPLTKTDAAGQTTTYTYNTQGQLATITTPPRAGITENRTTTYAYDTNGYLQSVTGPAAGATTSYTYDGYGRRRTVTDSEGYVLTYDYDALNRTTKVTHPDGTYEQTVYNRLDPQDRRDRRGGWSHTFFDALRRPVSVRDPANRTTTQQWCACGSLDKIIDANNSATTWDRDLQGRVTKETRADSSFKTFTYETTTSRLKTRTDAKGQVTTYSYLLDDNLGQTVYTNATIATPTVSLTYDPVYNRLSSMTDATGTTNYSYYPIAVSPTLGAGKLQAVDGPLANDTVSYGYDERGRVATRGLSAFSTTTGYDVLGRVTPLASPIGSFAWTYLNTTGRPQTVTYPNGQVTTYSYFNNVGDKRLQQIKHQQTSGGTVLSQFDYTYDAVGNISTWQQQLGATSAKVYNLGYDAADQLSSAVQKDASTQQILKNYGYAYDAAGNRTVDAQDSTATTSQYNNRNELTQQAGGAAMPVAGTVSEPATVTVSGTPASVNAANQFAGAAQVGTGTQNFTVVATDPSGNTRTNTYQVNVSGTTQSLVYDANGSLCAKGGTTCTNGTTVYEWDAENRLVDVKQGATTLAGFVYDGTGRRVQKTSSGVTHSFIYDGQGVVQERLSSGQTVDYVQGIGIDRTLAQRDQAGVVTYYLADHLGSIAQTTSSAGVVALTREYDPWGNLLQGGTTGGYAFTGREWDPETGLYNYRARYYEPKMARFTSEDPAGLSAGSDLFAYVDNNPTGWVDPFGYVKDHPRPRHPPRDCNAVEMEACEAMCGSKGVQSCKVAQTFRGRVQRGVQTFEWVDGPMSCSCNDPEDDDNNFCKKNPGTCVLLLILGAVTLFCTGPKLGPMEAAPAMGPPVAPNSSGGGT